MDASRDSAAYDGQRGGDVGCVSHLCEDAGVCAHACVFCGPWVQAENKDLKDKVLYTLAEMENVRTIARRYQLHQD